jgi:tetratricopeptide (TPR) repeat protein
MSFILGPRCSRYVLALVAVTSVAYAFVCLRSFRASQLASSQELSKQTLATQIEPLNADYWRRLGATLLYRENDSQGALAALYKATDLNTRDADAWIATAVALQLRNQPDEEREAISHALAAEPRRLEIVWQAENLYAALGDSQATLNQACVLLMHDRARGAAAMYLTRNLGPGVTAADCKSEEAAH